ncbi:MAG: class I SAM-dependent methyltransferase [Sedimentisphaerales bacterium]|nr:class I SAM-dependent methyltransferase [Sedimentisphaerales bacterium]
MSNEEQIQFNKQANDGISGRYDCLHNEIFNFLEQERLCRALKIAIENVKTNSSESGRITALDYGSGSGNLTRHLIEAGINTTSADVSDGFLSLIERNFSHTGLSKTMKINGKNLSGIRDSHFDLVATYSVLHHVPDYLQIVKEMCRVLKPGGVIYIDHEVIESYYHRPEKYIEFLKKARPIINLKRYLRFLFDVKGYIHIFKRLLNPRYKREGDIHVWPDDHIEWDKIERILNEENLEIIHKEDYLLYKSSYNVDVYNEYKDKCADERLLIARKQ